MDESDLLGVLAGLIAYGLAVLLGAAPSVYIAYLLDTAATPRTDEDNLVQQGNRAVAIELGTTILCQAILIRHAVYAAMAVIRSLFIERLAWQASVTVIVRSLACVAGIIGLSMLSVYISGSIFKTLIRRRLKVEAEIRQNGNVAMAIFYALVLIGMTLVLNEGIQDFSRSLIPLGRAGVLELP
jgi:uncharacterized membrane protein YjfL (UPF0719 family)